MVTLGSKKFDNDQTKVLQKILQDTIDIEELMADRRTANQDGDQTILEEESNTRQKNVIKINLKITCTCAYMP